VDAAIVISDDDEVELYAIPEVCFLSLKSIQSERAISGLQSVLNDPAMQDYFNDNVRLAIALLAERNAGKQSFWSPYIDTLPSHYDDQPLFWDDDEMDEQLQSPVVVRQVLNSRAWLKNHSPMLQYLTTTYPRLFPQDRTTIDDFMWSYYTIISRSFDVGRPANRQLGLEEEENITGLLPFVDLLNHAFDEQTRTSWHSYRVQMPENVAFYVGKPTRSTLQPGTELLWRYTEYEDSSRYLYRYVSWLRWWNYKCRFAERL
jgi:hypothetical protein